jgi:hypothetical protein
MFGPGGRPYQNSAATRNLRPSPLLLSTPFIRHIEALGRRAGLRRKDGHVSVGMGFKHALDQPAANRDGEVPGIGEPMDRGLNARFFKVFVTL